MHGPTLRLVALAAVATGLLAAAVPDAPRIMPAEAVAHVGQQVRVEGLVLGLRVSDGGAWFDLVAAGHALRVHHDEPPPPGWVQATGQVARLGGALVLWADDVHGARTEPAHRVGVAELAADPPRWQGRLVQVEGRVDDEQIRDGSAFVALGEGAWPREGWVRVTAMLRADDQCACHRLHAERVLPWTP